MPEQAVQWDTVAQVSFEVDVDRRFRYNVADFKSLLQVGQNVLAIHGVNRSVDSSDMLLVAELVGETFAPNSAPTGDVFYTLDGSDPNGSGGIPYTGPISLTESIQIRTQAFVGGLWSATNSALFTVEVPLRVSEIMFNQPGADDAEFLELTNVGIAPIDLVGVSIEGLGATYQFLSTDGVTSLAPGESIVIASNLAAFSAMYPNVPAGQIASRQYDGGLDNNGETLSVYDAAGGLIQSFRYDDKTSEGWYDESDGEGFSIVPVDFSGDYSSGANWRLSATLGGSPGEQDPAPLSGDFNGSGTVDRRDLVRLLRNFGVSTGAGRTTGDANRDGAVTLNDLALAQSTFGASVLPAPSPAASAAAPIQAKLSASVEALDRRRLSTHRRRRISGEAADRWFESLHLEPESIGGESLSAARSRLRANRQSKI
jgi:hypothetical protein